MELTKFDTVTYPDFFPPKLFDKLAEIQLKVAILSRCDPDNYSPTGMARHIGTMQGTSIGIAIEIGMVMDYINHYLPVK